MKLAPTNRAMKPGQPNGNGYEHPNGEGKSKLSWHRIRQSKQARFNPLRNLTPAVLSRQLDDFALGYLREFAITMDAMERRDDTLKCVAPKRKAALARRQWEICTIAGLEDGQKAEAEKHVEALQFFYNHCTATDAAERNQRGGFSLLIRQMLDSVGKKYAIHEVIWQPSPEGLTAKFNFVPLWFFENLTGELRFLKENYAYEGEPLEPGAWMVTVGEGLMEACAVAWMYKHLPLRDWLIYSQDFGRPPIEGITDAAQGTSEWDQLVDAVEAYSADLRTVHNRSAEIKVGNVISGSGEAPFEPLVERMDRRMSALWRGADLSTMSSGNAEGHGASLQGKEEHNMECDDAQLITETLNAQVDPNVIEWTFGAGVKPLAYIKVIVPPLKETTNEIAVDTFLRDSDAPLEVGPTLERYGRPLPEGADAKALLKSSTPAAGLLPGRGAFAANEASIQFQRAYRSFARDMQPLAQRLSRILDIADDTILRTRLQAFSDELPSLLKDINADPESAHVLTDILEILTMNITYFIITFLIGLLALAMVAYHRSAAVTRPRRDHPQRHKGFRRARRNGSVLRLRDTGWLPGVRAIGLCLLLVLFAFLATPRARAAVLQPGGGGTGFFTNTITFTNMAVSNVFNLSRAIALTPGKDVTLQMQFAPDNSAVVTTNQALVFALSRNGTDWGLGPAHTITFNYTPLASTNTYAWTNIESKVKGNMAWIKAVWATNNNNATAMVSRLTNVFVIQP